jgi:hypothetical protein
VKELFSGLPESSRKALFQTLGELKLQVVASRAQAR